MSKSKQSPKEVLIGLNDEIKLIHTKINDIENTVMSLIDQSEATLDAKSCENLQNIDLVFQATAALASYLEALGRLSWIEQELDVAQAADALPLYDMKSRLLSRPVGESTAKSNEDFLF